MKISSDSQSNLFGAEIFLVDFSMAFDLIEYNILLHELAELDVPSSIMSLKTEIRRQLYYDGL